MKTGTAHSAGNEACDSIEYRPYFPFLTLKCVGQALYRSRSARDYACLLDLDPDVVSWQCATFLLGDNNSDRKFTIDFLVEKTDGRVIVEIWDRPPEDLWWVKETSRQAGYRYEAVYMPEIRKQPRLQNAKDLIRYAGYDAPLGDRIRLQAALGEFGSLTLAECLASIRDGHPMQTMAALILKGHIEVDVDTELLGPDTVVRLVSQ
ncbi:hypothetical protein [Rhizobium sp. 1399]|uniref:hypothetical protein n=1 Tax=Rhizobium sp. 1399 TaxID=2817758 RepID=UPI002861FDF5|nr:hypothetical protein [Rhizobium sp. 1399]MDR6667078.1 hypothetical protein [Rhizobium sp. 1399]